jgi:hypothetical protein
MKGDINKWGYNGGIVDNGIIEYGIQNGKSFQNVLHRMIGDGVVLC